MSEFLAMGGYAWYVWMSYGAVAAALAVEIALVRARRRRALDDLRIAAQPVRPEYAAGARGRR
jgi:heme exporter protein D